MPAFVVGWHRGNPNLLSKVLTTTMTCSLPLHQSALLIRFFNICIGLVLVSSLECFISCFYFCFSYKTDIIWKCMHRPHGIKSSLYTYGMFIEVRFPLLGSCNWREKNKQRKSRRWLLGKNTMKHNFTNIEWKYKEA